VNAVVIELAQRFLPRERPGAIRKAPLRNRVQPREHRRRARLEPIEAACGVGKDELGKILGVVIGRKPTPEIPEDLTIVKAECLLRTMSHCPYLVVARKR
jgi:hypothetical protein